MNRLFAICAMAVLFCLNASAYTQVGSIDGPTWYEVKASSYAGGSGTKTDPYIINTPEQLALLSYTVNNTRGEAALVGQYYAIGADIDLGKKVMVDGVEQTLNWVPIGVGEYNGNFYFFGGTLTNKGSYVIKNMTIKSNSDGNANCINYGLFGHLKGHVDGIRMKGVSISGSGIIVGTICGKVDNHKTLTSIKNCTVENVEINAKEGIIGGIAGNASHCLLKNCVANVKMQGHICGGIVAQYDDYSYSEGDDKEIIDNCHAVVNIQASNNPSSSDNRSYAGGIVGYCYGNVKQVVQYCSASGSINCYADNRLGDLCGGLIGSLSNVNVENCCSSVSLSGATCIGGLVAFVESPSSILSCFANGYINASKGDLSTMVNSYGGICVGGLIGYIHNFNTENGEAYLSGSCFAGTVKKPQISSGTEQYYHFGSIVAFASKTGDFNTTMTQLTIDKNLNYLPVYPEDGVMNNVEIKKTADLTSDDEPYKSFYKMPIDMVNRYEQNGKELAFKDNFMLAAVPFYVKDKVHSKYNAWQVTTEFFLTPLAYNRATKKALASFNFDGGQDLSFLEVKEDTESAEKTVTPLDPGEADVVVAYNDVQRKIHLDITYGMPWNDNEPAEFPGGNGAKDDPYLIQNTTQLLAAINSEVYNRDDMYFRLANDIFMNTHLLQTDETVKDGARQWTPKDWNANLDGSGKSIYGLYVNSYKSVTYREEDPNYSTTHQKSYDMSGLFARLNGHLSDMAIVDSYVNPNIAGTVVNTSICSGLFCGIMYGNASIERCLAHGIVLGPGMCGGLVGGGYQVSGKGGKIEDCFSCVHVKGKGYGSSTSAGTAGGGIVGGLACDHIMRSVSVGKVENFHTRRGIGITDQNTENDSKTWYFDSQQMTTEWQTAQNRGEHTTSEMINGDIFTDNAAWQHEKGRYPILKQFANTPYGDIISMPVHFADGDRAGHVTKIFEFPIENVTWEAVNGATYVDMINECGAATPVSTTPTGGYEFINARTNTAKSQCTKALRVMALNTEVTGTVGIEFEDPKCEAAWLTAFGKSTGDVVTLRNAYTVNKNQSKAFNTNAKTKGVEKFNEMRFFVGIKNLEDGILSGLSSLSEVQLPKQLEYIGQEAFSGCDALAEVTLPATTQEVEGGAFDGSSVKDILTEPRCTAFEMRDHALFTTDADLYLVAYPPARGEKTITIHGPFHNIMYHAFYQIPELDEIYIDYPKAEGSAVQMDDDEAIVHWNEANGQLMDIYINDGSFDGHDENYHYETGGNLDGVLMKEYMEKSYWQRYGNAGKLHRYFPLTVSNAKWATMYIGFCTQLPEGLKAYIVPESVDDVIARGDNTITLKRVNNLLHHTVPVLIKAETPGTYILRPYEGTVENIPMSRNKLMGSDIGQDGKYGVPVNQSDILNEFSVLTLSYNSSGQLGFYGYTGETIPPYKAYLTFNGFMGGGNANTSFSIVIDDTIDEPTGVKETVFSAPSEGAVYDLQGRKIADKSQLSTMKLPRGIYIINGKKVMIK